MRVLLAEDEPALGTWLSKALEHFGIQVEWVNDGKLADIALRNADYDVLVLDLGLPGFTGEEVLTRLRARDQRLPTLVLTARNSSSDKVRLLNLGADDFLAKPFDLPELEARLHALVPLPAIGSGMCSPPRMLLVAMVYVLRPLAFVGCIQPGLTGWELSYLRSQPT
jgi:DNA-binding response OmpR family regulator